MKHWIKALGAMLIILMMLSVGALFLPDRAYQYAIETITQIVTERDVHLGDIRITRGLQTVVELSDVAFENAEWSARDSMIEVDRLTASFNLRAFAQGVLEISSLTFSGLTLHLEKNIDGKANWELTDSSMSVPELARIKLIDLSVTENTIHYTDKSAGNQHELQLQSLNFFVKKGAHSPVFNVRGNLNDTPVNVRTLSQHSDLVVSSTKNKKVKQHSLDIEANIGRTTFVARTHLNESYSGQLGFLTQFRQNIKRDIQLNINTKDTRELLRLMNIGVTLPGTADIGVTLRVENKHLSVVLHDANFEAHNINIKMDGTIDDALETATTSMNIHVHTPDMNFVTEISGVKMPSQWGPLIASGKLSGRSGHYEITEIVATLNGQSKATVTGSIASLIPFDNMQLNVEAYLATLAEISAFTANPLPDIGPFSGNGKVSWADGKLSLHNATTNYNGAHGIAVITGYIGDLVHFDQVRLRADADLPGFSALDLFTGFTMPTVDDVVVSTNLFSTQARDLSARNLTVKAQKGNVTISAEGSVDSIIKNKGILDLDVTTSLDSISHLSDLFDKDLPDIGPVKASAHLTGSKQNIELNDVDVFLNTALFNGHITSDVGYLNRLEALVFDVDITSTSIKDTLNKVSIRTAMTGPATLSSQVIIDLNDQSIELENALLSINGNILTGDLDLLNFGNPNVRAQISGMVELTNWNLMEVRDRPMGIRSMSEGLTSTDKSGMLLSDSVLPLNFLTSNDLDLKIQIGQFISTLVDVSDATLNLRSENGLLTVGPFSGMINNGHADLLMSVDTNQHPSAVSLTANLKAFDLGRAGFIKDSGLVENAGGTTLMLNLEGHGNSIADIATSANGEGGLYIENLVLKQGLLQVLSSDLLDQLVDVIDPSKENTKETRLTCSALAFQLNEGKLDTPMGFAVEAEKFAILGTASIDFNDETINVMINSKPKKGLGFSLNKFVNLVEIDGQLSAPKLSLSETGLLKLGASIAAAVASSGITLLAEGLWELQRANSNVCAKALGN